MVKTYHSSCTCGGVRAEVDVDLAKGTSRCNCSFCAKARFWFAVVPHDAVRIRSGAELLTDWERPEAEKKGLGLHFLFCSRCGVRPFSRGKSKDLGDFYAVNLGCLDDATPEELAAAPVHVNDGKHDHWKNEPPITSYF